MILGLMLLSLESGENDGRVSEHIGQKFKSMS